jgi:hypothetical protein
VDYFKDDFTKQMYMASNYYLTSVQLHL